MPTTWAHMMNNSDKYVMATAALSVTFGLVVLSWAAGWSLVPLVDTILIIGTMALAVVIAVWLGERVSLSKGQVYLGIGLVVGNFIGWTATHLLSECTMIYV